MGPSKATSKNRVTIFLILPQDLKNRGFQRFCSENLSEEDSSIDPKQVKRKGILVILDTAVTSPPIPTSQ